MNTVMLVVASRYGATMEIGDWIQQRLEHHSCSVERIDASAGDVDASFDGVDAVIVISAVYAGRWMPGARAFVERFGDALTARPTWLVSSGPVGDPLFPAEPPKEAEELAVRLAAREHRVLPGKVVKKVLTRTERAIMAILRAPEGDFRQREAVDVWVDSVIAELGSAGP